MVACLLIGLAAAIRPLYPQQSGVLPRFGINSKDDLIAALTTPDEAGLELRAAVVALDGRRVAFMLRDLLVDTSAIHFAREQALKVLYYTRDSLFLDDLLALAEGTEEWLKVRARETLQFYPYAAACDYWRAMVSKPEAPRHELGVAVAGLGYCGSARDVATLERILASARYQHLRRVTDAALVRIRKPMAERFPREIWGAAPAADGEFVPGAELVRLIGLAACNGPCRGPIVLQPDARLSATRR